MFAITRDRRPIEQLKRFQVSIDCACWAGVVDGEIFVWMIDGSFTTLDEPHPMDMLQLSLREYTMLLLKHRKQGLTYNKIADDTGLGRGWIDQLARHESPNPSVDKVQTLYEYLSGESLL